MDRTAQRRRTVLLILAAIVALALLVRIPIANRMLPQLPEPDAFQVLHAQEWRGDPALVKNWEYAQRYPKLLTFVFAAFPEKKFDEQLSGEARLEAALACAAAPNQRARYVVLFFSLCALPLMWLVARRFTGEGTALIATWLVATSLLHALFSTQGRPHGVHLTTSLLAVWGALRVVEAPTWKRSLAAVLFAAVAMATLQNGVFTLFPLALALFLSGRTWPRRIALAVSLPAVAAALAFTTYPALPSVDASGIHVGGALSHNVFFRDFNFGGLRVAARWFMGHDPALLALTILGLAVSVPWVLKKGREFLTGRRPHVAVALAYVVPYSLLLLVSQDVYERFLLPLLPWFAIVAARPWKKIVDERASSAWTLVSRAVLFLVLAIPLVVLARFAWVSTQADTFRQAADWITHDSVARQGRIVATPIVTLPFLIDPVALERGRGDASFSSRVWFAWQLAHPAREGVIYDTVPADLTFKTQDFNALDAWIAERRAQFIVFEVSRKIQMIPSLRHVYEWTTSHGELVHRSRGAVSDRMELGLADYQGIEDFARRLFEMSAFGPELEIWRITR